MSERDSRVYCADILDSGTAILGFVKGLSFEQFCSDRKTYSAVIKVRKRLITLEIPGEAFLGLRVPLEADFMLWYDLSGICSQPARSLPASGVVYPPLAWFTRPPEAGKPRQRRVNSPAQPQY